MGELGTALDTGNRRAKGSPQHGGPPSSFSRCSPSQTAQSERGGHRTPPALRARPSTVFAESWLSMSCLIFLTVGVSRWGRLRLLSDLDGKTLVRAEDERRLAPRRKQLARAPGASYSLIRNADCSVVARRTRSRISRKFRLGFSNASLDHPWRTAHVHSVEYGAVRSNDLVSSFAVRHARLDAARQARDVAELLKNGVDGLIVSAHDSVSLADGLAEAERQGVPVVPCRPRTP